MRLGKQALRTAMAAVLLAAAAAGATTPTPVTLGNAVSPPSGPEGITVSLMGTGFPSGTILAASITVTMQPQTAGAGPTASTPAALYYTVAANTRGIAFIVPSALTALQVSTPYLISMAGSTTAGTKFQSSNSVVFLATPPPQLVTVTPSAGVAGDTVAVTMKSQYTQFVQNVTKASFGPGISILGSPGLTDAANLAAQSLCRQAHQPPVVSVIGQDGETSPITLQLSAGATPSVTYAVVGTVISYSLAPGAQLTTQWTVTGGPGPVVFSAAQAATTNATFSVPGSYTLQFVAFDGILSGQAAMQINVIPNAPTVLSEAMTLTPPAGGPYPVGTTQYVQATVIEYAFGIYPEPDVTVQFTVTGAHSFTGQAVTDSNGIALLPLVGGAPGVDTVNAQCIGLQGTALQANTATVTWVAAKPAGVTTSLVTGQFFLADGSGVFNGSPSEQPVLTQTFPSVLFNPVAGTVPGTPAGITQTTRPMRFVNTASDGSYAGNIPVQGIYQGIDIAQPGAGPLFSFRAVFTGVLNVPQAGQVTLNIAASDGWVLGMGGGATRVSGPLVGAPAVVRRSFAPESATQVTSLPVVAANNQRSAPNVQTFVVNFPAAGAYPFELDWASSGGANLTMVLGGPAGPLPPSVAFLLTPFAVGTQTGGQIETFTVTATNSDGTAAGGIPINITVDGVIPFTRSATTDATGQATIYYQGISGVGVDTVQASGVLNNAQLVSNVVTVPWNSTGVNTAPVVSAGPDLTIMLPERAPLNGSVTDDGLPSNNLTIFWSMLSGPGTVTFDNPAQAVTGAAFSAPGNYVLQLSASDGELDASATMNVTVQRSAAWTAGWLALPNHSTVSGIVPIVLAPGVTLASGTLSYSPVNNDANVTVLNSNTVGSGQIGVLDTTLLPNGSYWVQLTATDSSGNTQYNLALVTVVGDYKPGRVTATVTDLVVPAKGLAINIQRRYDSLQSGQIGDFGYGWSLGTGVDLEVDAANDVTFTLGGLTRTFYFTPQPLIAGIPAVGLYSPAYTPEPGLHGQLTTTGTSCEQSSIGLDLLWQSGPLWMCMGGVAFSADGFIYTNAAGTQYTMGADGTLKSVQDLNGNTLTVTPAGILSSPSGVSVPFVRDAQGRITQITDTLGRNYLYGYDASGNLTSVTYPGIATPTRYGYDSTHLLTQETDRRGNTSTSAYDANGRLQSITDALGNTTQFAYDLTTQTTTVTNPDGGTVVTVANANGDPLSVTDPLGRTTSYTYDASRNVLTKTDALGKTWTYTYDANGNQTSAADPLGNLSQTQYNQYGGATTITDPLGNVQTATYDGNFRPVTISDSLGQVGGMGYDDAGDLTSLTNANGMTSAISYDSQGDVSGATDPLGHTAASTYDALGERLTMTDSLAHTTTYTYDGAGRLIQTTLADGSSTSTEYDDQGNVTARVDALGRRTTFAYDAANRLVLTSYPDGTTSSTTYNWRGQALTRTDQAGHISQSQYDLAGQLLQTTTAYGTPDAATTQQVYDADGRVVGVVDPRGNTSATTYDDAGRTIKTTNALNQSTVFTYDADGRQIAVTDPLGRTTQFTYDARGRRTATTLPDGTTTSATYDGTGQMITSTDQAGQVTQYTFDDVGEMTAVTDALSQVTRSAFDAAGNLLARTDANGHTTAFTYDVLNRVLTRTLPGGGNLETRAYNADGTLASVTDFNGKTTTFAYDNMGRLLSQTPDPSTGETPTGFTYTLDGRRASMTDATGTANYSYDNQDRLLGKASPIGTLTYTYDVAGNRLSVASSHVNGVNVAYSFDELNRVKTVTSAGKTTTYTYDAAGNLSQTALPNGVVIAPTRDVMDRITALPVTSTPPARYGYSYGPVGNRLTADTTSYSYDALYRLTNETKPAGALSYILDPVGNRLALNSTLSALASQSFTYDPNDRIVGNTYDANGNTLASGARTYSYDSQNRLVSFNGGALTMVYDGDGNRVAKNATQYLVDENNPTGLPQVVEELSGGLVQATYVYGLERISQTRGGVTSYYGSDAHGDVRFLMDGSGAVTDTYEYDAWGNLTNSTGTTTNVYLYQGEQYDAETKLYYFRARYFDSLTGRFLSVDPLAAQGQRPYLYAGGDPVNGHDPTGSENIIAYSLLLAAIALPPADYTSSIHDDLVCLGTLALSALRAPGVVVRVNGCKVQSVDSNPGTPLGPPWPGPPGGNKRCRDVVQFPEEGSDRQLVVLRLINENSGSSLFKRAYGIGDTLGNPTGPVVTWLSIYVEDRYFLTVLTNRLNSRLFRGWGSTLGQQAKNAGGQDFKGNEYPVGAGIYDAAYNGPAKSFACKDVAVALSACDDGPMTSDIASPFGPLLYWKGILQQTKSKHTILVPFRLGDIRVNNTDFSPRN